MIQIPTIGPSFSETLFLVFGLISVIVAMFFILIVKDYKRLLAYSSIEHMGIISIGFGIGGPIAIFGALFQILNHSLTKTTLFFGSGNILQKYNTQEIDQVKGLGRLMPYTAMFFIIGMFALTGCPPFSIFASEITILDGMISQQYYIIAAALLLVLVVIFAGFINHITPMIFGDPVAKLEISRGEKERDTVRVNQRRNELS